MSGSIISLQYIFFNGNLPQYAIKSLRDDQKLTCAQNYEHPFTSLLKQPNDTYGSVCQKVLSAFKEKKV